jgi:hypothetical protein
MFNPENCTSETLATVKELAEAYADGARWVAYSYNRSQPVYCTTEAQAVKARQNVHGERSKSKEKLYCGGSGEGIERIDQEILMLLTGTNAISDAKALRGLGYALLNLSR